VYQVALLPPDHVRDALDAFRRIHDPAFHKAPVLLPVLPPFEPGEGLSDRFDAFTGAARFTVSLGPARAEGRALVLPVEDGVLQLVALRLAVAAAVLGPHDPCPDTSSALRIGLFSTDAELELARRALGTYPMPEPFEVELVSLLREDERGLWHEVRKRRI